MKKILGTLLVAISGAPALAAEPVVPMFFDYHVEVSEHGKVRYAADVVLPRNVEVTAGGIRDVPIAATCKNNSRLDKPFTYKDGVWISVFAYGSPSLAKVEMKYAVAMPGNEGKPVRTEMGMCTADMIWSTVQSSEGVMMFSKLGEISRNGVEPVAVDFKLNGTYTEVPQGRIIGSFVEAGIRK